MRLVALLLLQQQGLQRGMTSRVPTVSAAATPAPAAAAMEDLGRSRAPQLDADEVDFPGARTTGVTTGIFVGMLVALVLVLAALAAWVLVPRMRRMRREPPESQESEEEEARRRRLQQQQEQQDAQAAAAAAQSPPPQQQQQQQPDPQPLTPSRSNFGV